MKKILILISLCLSLGSALNTQMPTNETNIVGRLAEVSSINYSTIGDPLPLFDNKRETAVFVSPNHNGLVLELRHPFYIREIKVYTARSATPENMLVRYAKTPEEWQTLTTVATANEGEFTVFTIRGEYVLATYLSFVVVTSGQAQVYEIEVYPETSMRLKPYYIKDHWSVTDTEAFNNIDTRIETEQVLRYSELGATTANRFTRLPAAKLEGELISLGNLLPGTAYEYKMTVSDYNGNQLNVDTRQFNTRPINFAAKKTYEGTFNTLYGGSKVSPNRYPLTDVSTNINTGMVLSGPVNRADQYVTVDLEQNRNISEIVLFWRALGYSKNYRLEASEDKQNWKTLAENINADTVTTARTADGHPVKVVFTKFPRTTARYIRLFVAKDSAVYSKHGTTELELFEFKVF